MLKNKRILALIPARGGSKGLPGKNIKLFAGKPLINWTIDQAQKSQYIDEVIVSTDNQDISQIAEDNGAKVPFLRPADLATDEAKIADVIKHLLSWLRNNENYFDIIVLLQVTSPLRKITDIDSAIEFLFEKKAKSIVSVCEVSEHPYYSNVLPDDLSMRDFIRESAKNTNRQELPSFYRINGAIYISEIEYFQAMNSFLGSETYAYVMQKENSIDIDTQIDFELSEQLMLKILAGIK